MRRLAFTLSALLLATAASSPVAAKPKASHAAAPAAAPADIDAAVSAPGRPDDQIKLDEGRRPVEVLKFEGLRRGDMALDLFAGAGYYSEIMGRAVGPTGGVFAWDPANFVNDKSKAAWTALKQRQSNVGFAATPGNALALPANAFDFAMIHLNYHDFYWESARYGLPRMDPNAILATLYQSMKPGGVVAVIDHVANAGGDTREVVEKLHRIDPATIKADFQRAGFVLEAESSLLRNPADDHSKLVFDPAIRYKTDRVVYRFRKPRK
ncbi:MAG TPA: methyltransferase [Allosphingosinicella sp.]|jgi:predicted methyltransferase|nr:methyltransferase [Allosphingosinicella sp.]